MALRAEGRAPRLVVIENVCGLITGHGGKDFVALCDAFTEGGYRVGAMVIDAEFFVPQSRDRVFIIGVDATLPIPASIVVDQPALPFHPTMQWSRRFAVRRRRRSGSSSRSRRRTA